jgi:hypothetical protein
MTSDPYSRESLVAELEESFSEFRSTLDSISEPEFEKIFLDGKWRVREIAAHVAGWLGQFAGGMERMARGEKPSSHDLAWTEVDRWNDVFADHAQGKRKPEIIHELDQAFASFKQAAAKLPDDRFGEGKTVSRFFDLGGISHFREHTEMIRAWSGA